MHTKLSSDQQQLPRLLQTIAKEAAERIASQATIRAAQLNSYPAIKTQLPQCGQGVEKVTADFFKEYADFLSASAGPYYYGFVTGGSTPAALIGDWLTAVFDQNVMGSEESIAANFEVATINMLRSLFHLADEFNGTFVSGATMSNFVGLATARQWLGKQRKINVAEEGIAALGEVSVFSATAHSSIYKSLAMTGLGRNCLKKIATLPQREAIDVVQLEMALQRHKEQSNHAECIVVANAGTVNTVDFDDLVAIGQLKKQYSFWLHVDAAFGGFARCSKKYQHLTQGLELADSITIDAHKWLNVPYDSALQFTRHLALQAEVFQNAAAYLRADVQPNNFINLTPENSRRFRALPVWFTLMSYGRDGYTEIIDRTSGLAVYLAKKMET